MTIQQTSKFMERIKQHYQEFIIDEQKIEEWHNELKEYDYEEVNQKLEEHLRHETFGLQIPKLFFLTKYLTKESDKEKYDGTYLTCKRCGDIVHFRQYEQHVDKCNSIAYIIRVAKRYYDKNYTIDQFKELTQEQFDKFYYKMVKTEYAKLNNDFRKQIIRNGFPNIEEDIVRYGI